MIAKFSSNDRGRDFKDYKGVTFHFKTKIEEMRENVIGTGRE